MATIANNPLYTGTERRQRSGHEYHAEAHLLSGRLQRPIMQDLQQQAPLSLRDWSGGHLYQKVQGYDLEGLVSFKSGYTRVSGYRSSKEGHAFVTLATSVIEGLNVLDVLTVDRVVAQVATSHPEYRKDDPGHVPEVTFLGTQFTNLKVSGYDVNVAVNPGICGNRPEHDVPYLFHTDFLNTAREQAGKISEFSDVPPEMEKQSTEFRGVYKEELDSIGEIETLLRKWKAGDDEYKSKEYDKPRALTCSLVDDIVLPRPIPGVKRIGNALYIRDFGIVTLGNISVGRKDDRKPDGPEPEMSNYFTIDMFDIRLGCIGEGKIIAASGSGNGGGKP